MSSLGDTLRRSLLPRAVIASGSIDWPHRLGARLRRGLGGRGRIELYFAFDDPYSAIAFPGLVQLAVAHNQVLALYPVTERGIAGDPAAEQRRLHAVTDSRRLARRDGRSLSRGLPLQPADTAFLAAWTESQRGHAAQPAFVAAALEQLWFRSSGPVREADYLPLFRDCFQQAPPAAGQLAALQAGLASNRQALLRRGHWESPAARVAGQWFFAHERIPQIGARLAAMGW
jgi:2-hydroxychromene-2-carboxylate isomerase